MNDYSRRKLLLSGAATGAVLLSGCDTNPAPGPVTPGSGSPSGPSVPPTPPPPTPPSTTTFTRRNIHDLASNDPIVEAYRTGVAVMKSRSTNDPTSWQYQANMHGTASAPPAGALWNMCRHGSGQFLPWHRMYIYFFERIVREASGDPNFALPFWDYSSPGQAMLPTAFRSPANATNSLWNGSRNGSVNAGGSMPFSTFTAANSMGFDQFLPAGFVRHLGPGIQMGIQAVQLEFQPHNVIHVAIGGDMGHPFTAGNDPIFWLHHCNVDRLWSAWEPLAGGRTNPTSNAAWMNQTFDFFDETGTRITMSNAQILDTSTMGGLGYIYDSFAFQNAKGSPAAGPAVGVPTAESGLIALGGLKKEVDLQPSIGMQSASASNTQLSAAQHAALVLDGVSASGDVGVYYEIYLNLPDGANPDPEGMHYVGVLDYFSAQSGGHAHHGGDTSTKRYEVGRILKRQKDAGIFTDLNKPPKLTFIANGMAKTQGGGLQINAAAQPVIGSSRIETAQ